MVNTLHSFCYTDWQARGLARDNRTLLPLLLFHPPALDMWLARADIS